METTHPSMLDLLLETHIGLERQGPGSVEAIEQALEFLKPLNQFSKIADLGCGTGTQTLLLAKYLSGNITGLDIFSNFIDKLNENAKNRNLASRVTGITGSMENLPFQKNSLDLIWSEGAIDNIGFEKGLSYWHGFLKKEGFIAVTCPSWLTKEQPTVVEEFWSDAGSTTNIKTPTNTGYIFKGWEVINIEKNKFNGNTFTFIEGTTTLKAKWEKIKIDPCIVNGTGVDACGTNQDSMPGTWVHLSKDIY